MDNELQPVETFPEITQEIKDLTNPQDVVLTSEQIKEMMYLLMIAGGNCKQYAIDNNISPEVFLLKLELMIAECFKSPDYINSIKNLLSSNMLLIGLFDELGK